MISMNKSNGGITGFENPCAAFQRKALNLNTLFAHSKSSMKLYVSENEYLNFGIAKDDWLLVDASRQPLAQDLVLVEKYDEQFVMMFSTLSTQTINSDDFFNLITVLGVLITSIHHFRKPRELPEHDSLTDIDLHRLLITKEHSTILCRAVGDSMQPFVFNKDLLLLERHLDVEQHDVCVLSWNDNLVCKRVDKNRRVLWSDNPNYGSHSLTSNDYLKMHGVVSRSFRLHRKISN